MTYRLSPRLFIEDGPAIEAGKALQRSSATAFQIVRTALSNDLTHPVKE